MDNSNSGSKQGLWLGISLAACVGIVVCACICVFVVSAAFIFFGVEFGNDFRIEEDQSVEIVEVPDGTALPVQAKAGYLAPDFQLETLEGDEYSLYEFRGQPVIVLYWASWCGYCKEELSLVQSMHAELEQQGIVVLAVNATDGDDLKDVSRYIEEQELPFPILLDSDGRFNKDFGRLNSLPTTFFIDADGVVQAVVIGTMTESAWRDLIAELD